MRLPRYEVRSLSGYTLGASSGDGKLTTTWWVSDNWNCCREVRLKVSAVGDLAEHVDGGVGRSRWRWSGKTTQFRRVAEQNCERLNAENEAWLHA